MLLEGRVPRRGCEGAGARERGRGTVCLGKTHMSEPGLAGLGLNPAYGGYTRSAARHAANVK